MQVIDQERHAAELARYSIEPLAVTRNGGIWPEPRHGYVLAACARWETPYITEWLSYHRSVGIDHVYLYCNDDDPAELWAQVMPFATGRDPFVTFRHYPIQGLQFQIYYHFLRNYMHETKWLMFLDIDEFICVRDGHDVPRLMARFETSADAVYFNWCAFGNNGHVTRPAGQVLLNHTRRERTVSPSTKLFVRSRSMPMGGFFHAHDRPIQHDVSRLGLELRRRNVLGEDLADYYEEFPVRAWRFLNEGDRGERLLATAFIAHYNIKSDADFELRVERGLAGDYAAEAAWGRKTEAERARHHERTNAVEDTVLHDYWRDTLARSWESSVFPRADWTLITPTGPETQSSTAHELGIDEDARGVLSRRLIGRPQSHTKQEADPWWMVDLGAMHRVHEVRLFNRLDAALDRMARFRIDTSCDGTTWTTWFEKTDDAIFGGADGTPFRHVDPDGRLARWISVSVPGPGRYFQLDQIEFYGDAETIAPSRVADRHRAAPVSEEV